MIPDPAIPWDDDMEVRENVSLQVEEDSRKEDRSKVIESEEFISKGGSPTYASEVQEQTPEERKWNQIHSAWSDYVHSEEMQYQHLSVSRQNNLRCRHFALQEFEHQEGEYCMIWGNQSVLWNSPCYCSGTTILKLLSYYSYDENEDLLKRKEMSFYCTMAKLNEAIAVELLPLEMRRAPIEFRNPYFKACRIGISQLNNAGQTAIKRLLEILTDIP